MRIKGKSAASQPTARGALQLREMLFTLLAILGGGILLVILIVNSRA